MYALEKIVTLATKVRDTVLKSAGTLKGRSIKGFSVGGDTQFDIDHLAETVVLQYVKEHFKDCFLFTEDYKDSDLENKKMLMIIDPIDGTRALAAGLEMATIAIAVAPLTTKEPTINDISQAFVMELKTGAWIYADIENENITSKGFHFSIPNLNKNACLDTMFWTFEFNGHPVNLMVNAYGHLIDKTANKGGVFIFNSATYSILKIITGQCDAYVDIGNRILKDNTKLLPDFERVGNGKVLHLFPYDIAAIAFIAKKTGVTISDGYNRSLATTKLLSLDWTNQQSCIAAANETLHTAICASIQWHNGPLS